MSMRDIYPKSHFIGRTSELEALQRWFDDPNAPWILSLYDTAKEPEKKGGVGKTWLLRKFAEQVRQSRSDAAVVMADFFNVSERDRVSLAQEIVAALEQLYPEWTARAFMEAVQYQGKQPGPSTDESESPEGVSYAEISAVLAADLQRLDTSLSEKQKTLLVIFDTFETIEQNPNIAVLSPAQMFPDTYQFAHIRTIISGRNPLDWSHPNWSGRQQEVQEMPLSPFSPGEMQDYIAAESIYEIFSGEQQIHALYERTEGRPILIGLAIDVLNHRILSFEQLVSEPQQGFEKYLVPQVNKLEDPLNWVILFMAHVYHRFNIPLLERILQKVPQKRSAESISPQELPDTLASLSFVRPIGSSGEFVLHDEMRRLVTKYCWEEQDRDQRFRKEISTSVISYSEQELAQATSEQQRQRYILEIVYHRAFVDPAEGLRYFLGQFGSAIRLAKTAFARLLLQEMQGLMNLFSPEQRYEVILAEVRLLREENDAVPALALLERLRAMASEQWVADNQISFLLEEGRCFRRQGRLAEAEDRFTRCLEMAQIENDEMEIMFYLPHLGNITQLRGEFTTALQYYEQSMLLSKKLYRQVEYANALLNTATAYRLMGKFDEALHRGKVGWQLRLTLFQDGKIGENLVGGALYMLGQIYLNMGKIVDAERYFNEAFEIYLRVGDKTNIARTYNRFGAVQLAKGDLDSARAWFIKGEQASQNINPGQSVNSFNKQGRICLAQQQWEQAVSFFERAIRIAHSIPDHFQETESLIDLAITLEYMGQGEKAQQSLNEAEELANRDSYSGLLGQIEQQRAEVCYKRGDYTQAFRHFASYGRHMLDYNDASFNQAVQKVVDALLGIPRKDVPEIVEVMHTYQAEHQVGGDYSKLIRACEDVNDFMVQWGR